MAHRFRHLTSSGSKKPPNMHVWVKPILHTHAKCGLRFIPVLHIF